MDKINWTDRMKNEIVMEERILHTLKRMKNNRIGDNLHRNCRIKHVIKEKIE
jgi:hypothetical protein